VLTASVLFPAITAGQILAIMVACAAAALASGAVLLVRRRPELPVADPEFEDRDNWRMPPLNMLAAPVISGAHKAGLTALRAYLLIAMILVIVKIAQVALGH
jgi:hypothetical protein